MRLASLWEIREVIRLDFGIASTSDSKQRNYYGLRQLHYHFLCVVAPCSLSSKNNKFHISRSLIIMGFWVFKIPPILSLPQEQVKLPSLVRFSLGFDGRVSIGAGCHSLFCLLTRVGRDRSIFRVFEALANVCI